jgi:hypothetical protein
VRNPEEAKTTISTPRDGASRTRASIERTTPLICGSQASVTIKMRVKGGTSTRIAFHIRDFRCQFDKIANVALSEGHGHGNGSAFQLNR